MDWIDRTLAACPPGVARSIEARAEDGHLIRAELVTPQPGTTPTIMVTCEPVTFDDGPGQLERFPTFMEIVEAADELAPLCMFTTSFPTYPPGERQPPPPGARTIPLSWMGKVAPPSGIEVVGSIGG